ncbi:putative protein OS=Streptomyces aurantiogriseus OX=66870 GN=GCM10010251_49240 PE=4 SV=1 [Streptomyces aurantiogriseus]|uniref:Uncharacterized protein n=1 Tax=Streptomyces aurantiogriseus TaxID=66870 RepID=A0A918CK74_9ACTN|nr:hypothetical protein GCM10010251_49240 [Streptomyces aurantiogriseus]
MVRYVYAFTEGGRDMADLLGGKGGQPGRDDPAGSAGAAGLHRQHRGLPRNPRMPMPADMEELMRAAYHGPADAPGE